MNKVEVEDGPWNCISIYTFGGHSRSDAEDELGTYIAIDDRHRISISHERSLDGRAIHPRNSVDLGVDGAAQT
jgi:hypothetical protein